MWNQTAQASFLPPSTQVLSRQPLSVSPHRCREVHPANVTVLSPEEMRTRFSGNRQTPNIHVPVLACLQAEGRAKTPAQARRKQGSCRERGCGVVQNSCLILRDPKLNCSSLCPAGTSFMKDFRTVPLLPNLRFLGKTKIRKEREILLLQETLQLGET